MFHLNRELRILNDSGNHDQSNKRIASDLESAWADKMLLKEKEQYIKIKPVQIDEIIQNTASKLSQEKKELWYTFKEKFKGGVGNPWGLRKWGKGLK